MKDFYSPETETSNLATEHVDENHIDLSDTVRIDCPKCSAQRAHETNRVSVTMKKKRSKAFITRYKCVRCGHSWVVYEKEED